MDKFSSSRIAPGQLFYTRAIILEPCVWKCVRGISALKDAGRQNWAAGKINSAALYRMYFKYNMRRTDLGGGVSWN